jgi:hypothetical protein
MTPDIALALDTSTAEELEYRVATWPDRARRTPVTTDVEFREAGELLTGIKTLRKAIADACDPVVGAAYRAHKAATEQKRKLEAPLVEAESILKARMSQFQREEEDRRRREEARLREEARKAEEAARLEEAMRLEAEGEPELADAVLEQPAAVVLPPVLPPPPKVAGIATRKIYRAEVLDVRALCKGIADGSVPSNLVLPNQSALNQMATALKDSFAIVGCRVVVETSIAAGRR